MIHSRFLISILGFALLVTAVVRAEKEPSADIKRVDADYALQGEYTGEAQIGGDKKKVGVQVIALGGGKFHGVYYPGGLPGDGWDKDAGKKEADGQLDNGTVLIKGTEGSAEIKDGKLTIKDPDGNALGTIDRIIRKSPTLDAKAPDGAVVLFDGKSADEWKGGRLTEDGLLMQGTTSKKTFGSCTLHVEFMLPYVPKGRGQDRGNSGCYLQGRYEVQILDSFGLAGDNHEAGGIYSVSDPLVNMCLPPLQWQTYDIDFTAATWENGKKVQNARMTVKHNGVLIQDNVEIPKITTAAPVPETADNGPIYLQDHGHHVRFKNIWIVNK